MTLAKAFSQLTPRRNEIQQNATWHTVNDKIQHKLSYISIHELSFTLLTEA